MEKLVTVTNFEKLVTVTNLEDGDSYRFRPPAGGERQAAGKSVTVTNCCGDLLDVHDHVLGAGGLVVGAAAHVQGRPFDDHDGAGRR